MSLFLAENSLAGQAEANLPLKGRVSFENIGTLLGNIVIAAMVIAGLMVFFYLIMGGIQYITSGGDKAQAEAARDRITYALIGLVIVVGSFAIIKLIEAFFGIHIIDFRFPNAKSVVDVTNAN